MKKAILALLISILPFLTKAQTYDTTLSVKTGITCVKITPVIACISDTDSAVVLGVRIISDDLATQDHLYFQLFTSDGKNVLDGNISITGDDYQNWTGDNTYPFIYVADKLHLHLK